MNVYTYYADVPGMPRPLELLALWKQEWNRQGWTPMVLTEKDAKDSPQYLAFNKVITQLPSVNQAAYERACYLRHLAMTTVTGGLLTDYDVIPRTFTPRDCVVANDGRPLTMLEPTRVPCAVVGTTEGFQAIVDFISNYQLQPDDVYSNRPHVSDMTILRKSTFPFTHHCVEHLCSGRPIKDDPGDGWMRAPMVHYSQYSFYKRGWHGPKHKLILRAMEELPINAK